MTAATLTPGFYGKLPSAGDFVARSLPPAFIHPWDRWLARHLAHLPPAAPPLFFRRAGYAGVILPSHDRAGRRFPLILAVAGTPPAGALSPLAALGTQAIAEALSPDALAARLATAALPASPPAAAPFLLWTDPAAPRAADPDAPGPVLAALLGEVA